MKRSIKFFKLLFLTLILAYFVFFTINNQSIISIKVQPFLQSINLPTYLVFIATFFLGSLLTFSFTLMSHLKKNMRIKGLQKEVSRLRSEKEKTSPKNNILTQ